MDQLCTRGGTSSTDSDQLQCGAGRGGHTMRAATAPSVPQPTGTGGFAVGGRMARLAALYAGAPDAASGGGPATFDELRVQVGGYLHTKPVCLQLLFRHILPSLTSI